MDSKASYEIPTPPNFKVPQREDPTQPFDVVCSIMPSADGKTLCFTQIGDTVLPYDEKKEGEEKAESKPAYSVPSESPMGSDPSMT